MNVLTLGARVIGIEPAVECAARVPRRTFSGEPRHRRRLDKVLAIEAASMGEPARVSDTARPARPRRRARLDRARGARATRVEAALIGGERALCPCAPGLGCRRHRRPVHARRRHHRHGRPRRPGPRRVARDGRLRPGTLPRRQLRHRRRVDEGGWAGPDVAYASGTWRMACVSVTGREPGERVRLRAASPRPGTAAQ